jgi:hypothetical protein
MIGFVYLWTNTENGMKYIGSHKGDVNDSYIGSGVYFRRAYNKNPKNFERQILYVGEDFLDVEDSLLNKYDVANNNDYYNLKNDAIGGWEHCNNDLIIAKRAKSVSKAKKGKAPSCASRNKNGDNNPMFGKTHSESTKKKIALKRKGVANKKYPVIELTTGMYFEKVLDAANYYGVTSSTMSVLIRNEKITKGKCKDKIFKYA